MCIRDRTAAAAAAVAAAATERAAATVAGDEAGGDDAPPPLNVSAVAAARAMINAGVRFKCPTCPAEMTVADTVILVF